MPVGCWPAIAGTIGGAWPAEAVAFDLRWFANRERMDGTKRPGRPSLMARWGWTDHRVRKFIKGGSWEDEKFQITSAPPVDRQPTASRD